ncbi:uncharacterized protein LAESUDRAFT_728993, partial [Laetiporus sulphureus 93-53]
MTVMWALHVTARYNKNRFLAPFLIMPSHGGLGHRLCRPSAKSAHTMTACITKAYADDSKFQ